MPQELERNAMRITTLATCICSVLATPLAAAPLEEDAIYSTSKWSRDHAQTLADEASRLIQRRGYRCDSVSSINHSHRTLIFTLTCNGFRYQYEVEDRGGRWVVRLK